ncbi:hypothetical protein DdX_21363 [Ditylenchus destructor]|uniref:Uncharacterized protein n=1 Tax=Ditylenchus destructor TaxID=166010 RepID=A0AAD4MGL2_9BILA|nr:hypothetical protein DdX_21363 [Ditylenchus destructor]
MSLKASMAALSKTTREPNSNNCIKHVLDAIVNLLKIVAGYPQQAQSSISSLIDTSVSLAKNPMLHHSALDVLLQLFEAIVKSALPKVPKFESMRAVMSHAIFCIKIIVYLFVAGFRQDGNLNDFASKDQSVEQITPSLQSKNVSTNDYLGEVRRLSEDHEHLVLVFAKEASVFSGLYRPVKKKIVFRAYNPEHAKNLITLINAQMKKNGKSEKIEAESGSPYMVIMHKKKFAKVSQVVDAEDLNSQVDDYLRTNGFDVPIREENDDKSLKTKHLPALKNTGEPKVALKPSFGTTQPAIAGKELLIRMSKTNGKSPERAIVARRKNVGLHNKERADKEIGPSPLRVSIEAD